MGTNPYDAPVPYDTGGPYDVPAPSAPGGVSVTADSSQILRLDRGPYRLRLVQPTAGGGVTVLGKAYGAIELPMPITPTSPDLVSGVINYRLNDAGDAQLTFPSTLASSGIGRWKDLFNVAGHLQWVEIYRDDALEFAFNVQTHQIGRDVVVIGGTDGFGLLKKWYENDNYLCAAPRDVISTYTRAPQVVLADDFPGSSLAANWSVGITGSGTIAVGSSVCTFTNTSGSANMNLVSTFSALADDWRITCTGSASPASGASTCGIYVRNAATGYNIVHADSPVLGTGAGGGSAGLTTCAPATGSTLDSIAGAPYPSAVPNFTITLEKRGRWFQHFFNGVLVGRLGVPSGSLNANEVTFSWNGTGAGMAGAALNLQSIYVTSRVPFLESGSDHGDYVLPGAQPYGGLHAKYFVDTDLLNLAAPAYLGRTFHPEAKAPTPVAERLDTFVNFSSVAGTWNLAAGSSPLYFSARWTGSVYLKLSAGDYALNITVDDYCRIWIGQTRQYLDTPLIDNSTGSPGSRAATISATTLGGLDGWYPIIIEFTQKVSTYTMQVGFTPPVTYTDPGGTSLTNGVNVIIPATSLSPLGIYEARIQGQSAFDLVQQTAKDYGYSLTCEPKQLESGEFPGRLVARVREGRDTDVVLRVEDLDTDEPLMTPQVIYDATALANVIRGSATALPDGTGSNAQIEAYDCGAMAAALFAIEQWQDAGDGALLQLLTARQGALLSLTDSPWQNLTGVPRGIERLADTFPLTGALAAMRWRPGDGVRVKIPEISVDDLTPRQIMTISRTFTGLGRMATAVGFRQRPRNPVETIRQMMRTVAYPQRIRKHQITSVPSPQFAGTLAASASTNAMIVTLSPSDNIQKAILRVSYNSTSQPLTIYINGSVTATFTSQFGSAPVDIDLTPYATFGAASDSRFSASATNAGASSTSLTAQLIVTVLR